MRGKIYTKKGDGGETSTFLGKMSKSDTLAEVLGTIDELNSWIGICRTDYKNIEIELKRIQSNLMTINAIAAGSPSTTLKFEEVEHLEKLIDRLENDLPQLSNFIYLRGELQVARSIARRCERHFVKHKNAKAKQIIVIMKYLNRLSDALFVMGRWVNLRKGIQEEIWIN